MSKKEQLKNILIDYGSEFFLKENCKVGFKISTTDRFVDRICNEFGITDDKPEPKKRYFIVIVRGIQSTGLALHIETNGEYVTMDAISNAITEQWTGRMDAVLFPANIIELNESDYKDWVK